METINDMIKSQYFDKGVDFSGTDFAKNDYQLWVSKNVEKNVEKQSWKPWVGELIHDASYRHPEVDVIKEFSAKVTFDLDATIGGSIDRLEWNGKTWNIADIKSQGNFPAQKNFKEPSESWIIQLSVYRWLLRHYNLEVEDVGIIHQYVLGYQKKKGSDMKEYNKIEIPLMSYEDTEILIRNKIEASRGEAPLLVDCVTSWQCDYCSYSQNCRHYKGGE